MLNINADQLPRVMACHGSLRLAQHVPYQPEQSSSEARDEGTAAHWLAEQVFSGVNSAEELVDRKAPNGVYITADMAEHVEWYLDGINSRLPVYERNAVEVDTTWFEGIMQIFKVHGRGDHIGLSGDHSTLFIDDFKYGWRLVDPERNWTLISHAFAFCHHNQIQPPFIEFTIWQPRPWHPLGKARTWRIIWRELEMFAQDLYGTLAQLPDTLQTGSQCQGCAALAICPAARQASYNAIDVAETGHRDEIPDDMIGFELETLETAERAISERLSALRELTTHRIKNGASVSNWQIVATYGNRRWKDGMTPETLQMLTGKDLTQQKLLSPPQAVKQAGLSDEVIAALVDRPSTGTRLVRVNANKRAEQLFGRKE